MFCPHLEKSWKAIHLAKIFMRLNWGYDWFYKSNQLNLYRNQQPKSTVFISWFKLPRHLVCFCSHLYNLDSLTVLTPRPPTTTPFLPHTDTVSKVRYKEAWKAKSGGTTSCEVFLLIFFSFGVKGEYIPLVNFFFLPWVLSAHKHSSSSLSRGLAQTVIWFILIRNSQHLFFAVVVKSPHAVWKWWQWITSEITTIITYC